MGGNVLYLSGATGEPWESRCALQLLWFVKRSRKTAASHEPLSHVAENGPEVADESLL